MQKCEMENKKQPEKAEHRKMKKRTAKSGGAHAPAEKQVLHIFFFAFLPLIFSSSRDIFTSSQAASPSPNHRRYRSSSAMACATVSTP